MNKELSLSSLKKINTAKKVYPTKTTINLLKRVTVSMWLPKVFLYSLFVLVCLLALLKIGVYDKLVALHAAENALYAVQDELDAISMKLMNYNDVADQYNRYSYGYLSDEEKAIVDRNELMDILETCVNGYGAISSLTITDGTAVVNLSLESLDSVAEIVTALYQYDYVEAVTVTTASTKENDTAAGSLQASMAVTVSNGYVPEDTEEGGDAK